jgi:hypothetical protein
MLIPIMNNFYLNPAEGLAPYFPATHVGQLGLPAAYAGVYAAAFITPAAR